MKRESAVPGSSLKKKRGRGNWFARILGAATVLVCAAFFGRDVIITTVSRVEFLSEREVSQSATLEGILIKKEKVVNSPVSGRLHRLAADGERLETGAEAVHVLPLEQGAGEEIIELYTPCAGIFCTHTDGLESVLDPVNLDTLEPAGFEKTGDRPVPEGGRIEKGKPAFKIIDNLSQVYFFARISKAKFPSGFADKPGWIEASWENLPFLMKPVKITDRGEMWEGVFLLSGHPEKMVHLRKVSFSAITGKLSGFVVPGKALVYRDGEPGIFLVYKMKAQWVPVRIEGELAGKAAISGPDLSENARYVSNPVLIRDKWPVK
ncbi:MAG TPA: HlyD family efflux transporter periplasmic adaptor subunit [Bacillota bacterium]|nr:HlyD family efflux transporter periplasmic adaptor subunit [Bacillota bacterium]